MEASREFFMGLGHGYGEIIGIIIAAAVFVAGMNATGIVETATNWMKGQQTASTLSAAIGPWALAVVCGSGNAATQAFNEAVTVHALDLGVNIVDMGSLPVSVSCVPVWPGWIRRVSSSGRSFLPSAPLFPCT